MHHSEKERTLTNCNRGQSGWDSIVSPEKKQEVHQSVVNGPKKLHGKRAQELTLSPSTVWRVMTNNLRLFPYKILTHHVLKEQGKEKCIAICEWFNNKLEQTPSWLNHIYVNGAVNNHNNIFWGEWAPEEIREGQLLKGAKSLCCHSLRSTPNMACSDHIGLRSMARQSQSTVLVTVSLCRGSMMTCLKS